MPLPRCWGREGPTGGRPGSQETCPRTRLQFLRGARGCSRRPGIPDVRGRASPPPISSRRSAAFFCPLREAGPPPSFPKKPRRRIVRGGQGCPGHLEKGVRTLFSEAPFGPTGKRVLTPFSSGPRGLGPTKTGGEARANPYASGIFHFERHVMEWGFGE